MGVISQMVKAGGINLSKPSKAGTQPFSPEQSRHLWTRIFSGTNKEEGSTKLRQGEHPRAVVPGGSYGRSLVASDAAIVRLLQALRSMAPGGWSDDRWEQTKHYVGIQYVAIHRTGEQLAQSEFQVFQKDKSHPEGKKPAEGPEAERLIRVLEKPNPEDSFGDLMYQWNLQMNLTGMSLTWMVPNKLGEPFELYPIPTSIAIPQPAVNPDYPDGYYRIQPVYPYGPFSSYPTPNSAVGAAVPAQWMMRCKFPHPLLRYEGYSPLTALRLHIDEVEQIDRSRWYSMKGSINPSAVLNMEEMEDGSPLPEPEIERIRAEFENSWQGTENHGRLFVSAPGSKLEPWGNSPKEMEFQQGWEQLVSFVLGGLGITKQASGMIDDSSYSTLFASLKQLYWLTLEPMANRLAKRLTRTLAPFFGDDLIIEVRCKRIDDHDVTNGKIQVAMSAKAITKNEVRQELDMPTTDEEWGNEIAGEESQQGQEQQPGMGEEQGVGGEEGGFDPEAFAQENGMEGVEETNDNQEGQEEGSDLPEGENSDDANQDAEGASGGFDPEAFAREHGLTEGGEGEDEETERQRPKPGKLGEGALGPRMKALQYANGYSSNGNGHHKDIDLLSIGTKAMEEKSTYQLVMEAIRNGR